MLPSYLLLLDDLAPEGPGLYATAFYYRYDIDSIRARNGNLITLDRSEEEILPSMPLLLSFGM